MSEQTEVLKIFGPEVAEQVRVWIGQVGLKGFS